MSPLQKWIKQILRHIEQRYQLQFGGPHYRRDSLGLSIYDTKHHKDMQPVAKSETLPADALEVHGATSPISTRKEGSLIHFPILLHICVSELGQH